AGPERLRHRGRGLGGWQEAFPLPSSVPRRLVPSVFATEIGARGAYGGDSLTAIGASLHGDQPLPAPIPRPLPSSRAFSSPRVVFLPNPRNDLPERPMTRA